MASTTNITTAGNNNKDKDDKDDKEKIIVFAKICKDRYGYPSNKREDVYYKEMIDPITNKPSFVRVYVKNNNKTKTK
jgi:hypothetical protein